MLGDSCFEGILIKSTSHVICYPTVFMKYCAGLNNPTYQEIIRKGAEDLVAIAMAAGGPATIPLLWLGDAIPSSQDPDDGQTHDAEDNPNQ
jgi:hypothetical protein